MAEHEVSTTSNNTPVTEPDGHCCTTVSHSELTPDENQLSSSTAPATEQENSPVMPPHETPQEPPQAEATPTTAPTLEPAPAEVAPMPAPTEVAPMPAQQQQETPPSPVPVKPRLNVKGPPDAAKATPAAPTKSDDKLGIYKALAIKLKKELVKCREEFQKLQVESGKEITDLRTSLQSLEQTLETERQSSSTSIAALGAKVRALEEKLRCAEEGLLEVQTEFDGYKARATKIMQQSNNPLPSHSNRSFEEEKYRQLRELCETHKKHISKLETQLSKMAEKYKELDCQSNRLKEELASSNAQISGYQSLASEHESLLRENESLRITLKKFGPTLARCEQQTAMQSSQSQTLSSSAPETGVLAAKSTKQASQTNCEENEAPIGLSPGAIGRDESQTNSSSSIDDGSSGFVHIHKPNTFEIFSRSSVLEDAQNQIDNLTKAYLDSESTNALLSDQVRALKEEIRRIQRAGERLDLAENLEYLKNVVFKFLSLDSNQTEQKQRLIPVLSTVLRLSPAETAQLTSATLADKPGVASTLFKF